MAKRITRATIKSFVRKNRDNLEILIRSKFDGMTDGIETNYDAEFCKCEYDPNTDENTFKYTLGHVGIWLVGSSRNTFEPYSDDNGYRGYIVYNACGTFTIAVNMLEVWKDA